MMRIFPICRGLANPHAAIIDGGDGRGGWADRLCCGLLGEVKGKVCTMCWKRSLPTVLAVMILVAVGCGTNGTPSPSSPRLGAIQRTVADEGG